MRRNLLVLFLGIAFLIVMTWLATTVTELLPHRPTPQVQTAQAGLYQVTLRVTPDPPSISGPATLSLQIVRRDTQRAVANAHVTLDNDMEAMNMDPVHVDAQMQTVGTYQAQLRFSMSGLWRVRVQIAVAGSKTESATFQITAK